MSKSSVYKNYLLILLLSCALMFTACRSGDDEAPSTNESESAAAPVEVDESNFTETDSGLMFHDFETGEGDSPEEGSMVSVHYTGWLTDGTKFDSSYDRGTPITFALGQGQVIAGWDEGISTMQVGGKRQLMIPPSLAYADAGYGSVIPPDSTLIFEVELVDIQ